MSRGLWDRETVALLLAIALLAPAAQWLLVGGSAAWSRLALALACVAGWQAVWTVVRAQPPSLAGLVTALAVAMLAPEGLAAWQILLGLSFGLVFADLAFGGWGRNVLHPATVTLAFLGFGFPGAPWPGVPEALGWSALPAAALGAALGILALDLMLAAAATFALAAWLAPDLLVVWPALGLVLVLLVADPVAGPDTRLGRPAIGALYAALAALFHATWSDAPPVGIAVSAALLVSLAAPLTDEAAIALWLRRRRARHG